MTQTLFRSAAAFMLALLAPSPSATQAPAEPPSPEPSAAVREILDEAMELARRGQQDEFMEAVSRALAAAGEADDAAGEACALQFTALVVQGFGWTELTVAMWRQAAAAFERAGDGPGRVQALAFAALHLAEEEPAEAEQFFAQALVAVRAEAKRPFSAATTLVAVVCDYLDQGLFGPARELLEASLTIQDRLAPQSLEVAATLNLLAVAAREQGDLDAALGHLRRALSIQELRAVDRPFIGDTLQDLGLMAQERGDLAAAREYWRRALAARAETDPDSSAFVGGLLNLGIVACEQGDLAAAWDYCQRALATQRELPANPELEAMILNELGAVAYAEGNLEGAERCHRRALTIRENLVRDHRSQVGSLNNLGLVASDQDNWAAAEQYYRRALSIEEELAPGSVGVAAILHNLGALALEQNEPAQAQGHLVRALAIFEKLAPGGLNMAGSLNGLALAAYAQGDLVKAEGYARQAWGLVRQQAGAVTGDEARQAFGGSTANVAATLMRVQLALGQPGEAFVTLEEGRAQALLQLLAERRLEATAPQGDLVSEYRAAVAARDRAEQVLAQAGMAEARALRELDAARRLGAGDLARWQEALEAAREQFEEARSTHTQARVKADQLWADIEKSSPRAYPPTVTLEKARQALPADALFVAFLVGKEKTRVFLLRSASHGQQPVSVHTIPVTLGELEAEVLALLDLVTDPATDVAETATASRKLFAKLFPEEEGRAAVASAQRLLISPNHVLWRVPFAALVTNGHGPPEYLGADKCITYTPSLTLFAQSRGQAPGLAAGAKPSAVVVGNPVFDRQPVRSASAGGAPGSLAEGHESPRGERHYVFSKGRPPRALPRTKSEAEAIARLYGSTPLTEERATEAALRERIETADVIHLATHGYLHPVRPMSSGVLLTVPEKEPEIGETTNDGVLQAWEIYSQLKLRAELAVFSACETGRGEIVLNEGIIGLTRALQYAGARTIVASRWKVADQSTATLMVAFHRYLRQGLAKDEALRRAMALVRENRATAHPYYWAPFFLMGDPDNPNLRADG